jgi:hypothetical protein
MKLSIFSVVGILSTLFWVSVTLIKSVNPESLISCTTTEQQDKKSDNSGRRT